MSIMPEAPVGHLIPSNEVVDAFKDIKSNSTINNILEIGFNTGWSSYIMLKIFKNAYIFSVEINKSLMAEQGFKILSKIFNNRIKMFWEDSKVFRKNIDLYDLRFNNLDTIFIDGDHS